MSSFQEASGAERGEKNRILWLRQSYYDLPRGCPVLQKVRSVTRVPAKKVIKNISLANVG
jgi:hypothetical protein